MDTLNTFLQPFHSLNTLLITHSIYNNNYRITLHTTYSTLFRIAVYVLSITLRISLLTPHGAVCHSEMVQPSCSIDNPYAEQGVASVHHLVMHASFRLE